MLASSPHLLILGAGAAGLFAAIAAATRGLGVIVVDHARKPGRKIVVSGGGRCNVTNEEVTAADFLCGNPHFVKSALARWSPWDMRAWLEERGLPLVVEEGGKVFCSASSANSDGPGSSGNPANSTNPACPARLGSPARLARLGSPANSARSATAAGGAGGGKRLLELLWAEARGLGVDFRLQSPIRGLRREADGFAVDTELETLRAPQVLVATGGLAWPQLGATDLGHRIARQFALAIIPPRPGLVPFMAPKGLLPLCQELAGMALPVAITGDRVVSGDMLFTHQGISGPAVLDASLFWRSGQALAIDLLPSLSAPGALQAALQLHARLALHNALATLLPARLAQALCAREGWAGQVAQCAKKQWTAMEEMLHRFPFSPAGVAGHAKAEVTLGGVAVDRIDSKTLQCKDVPGLYFAGEVLDVTGRLGGFNLHWAWASGRAVGIAAGQAATA